MDHNRFKKILKRAIIQVSIISAKFGFISGQLFREYPLKQLVNTDDGRRMIEDGHLMVTIAHHESMAQVSQIK